MIQRIVPDDAGPVANMLLSIEVVKDMVTDYERNSDNSYKLDVNGNPIALPGKVEGYVYEWHKTSITSLADVSKLGAATQSTGTLTGVDALGATTTSTIYPIIELRASSVGSDGNNTGVRIWAPTQTSNSSFDSRILNQGKIYPIRMAVMRRENANSTGRPVTNTAGEQNVLVTLKSRGINPVTGANFDIASKFVDAYQNVNDPRYPI
jgi:hypothetical protein